MEAPRRGTFSDLEKYVEEQKEFQAREDRKFWSDSKIWREEMDKLNRAVEML